MVLTAVERLNSPLAVLSPAALAGVWRSVALSIEGPRPVDFDDGPGLPARLRGAWGHALLHMRRQQALAPGQSDEAAQIHDVLFHLTARVSGPGPAPLLNDYLVPRPYVPWVKVAGNRLTVGLTLFGFVIRWGVSVMQSLLQALWHGITLFSGAHVRARVAADQVQLAHSGLVAVPEPFGHRQAKVQLVFESPVAILSGGRPVLTATTLLANLARRVAGLARWQDFALDLDQTNLDHWLDDVRIAEDHTHPVSWDRWSGGQGRRRIPMHGLMGSVVLHGTLDPWLPLLAIGAACHTGNHAALGQGRYSLLPLP